MRQVRFDLTPHALDLFPYAGRDLRVTGRGCAFRFMCEQGERCLEPMRQVAGARGGPRDCLFLVRQQQIELVDERLHLGGIRAGDVRDRFGSASNVDRRAIASIGDGTRVRGPVHGL